MKIKHVSSACPVEENVLVRVWLAGDNGPQKRVLKASHWSWKRVVTNEFMAIEYYEIVPEEDKPEVIIEEDDADSPPTLPMLMMHISELEKANVALREDILKIKTEYKAIGIGSDTAIKRSLKAENTAKRIDTLVDGSSVIKAKKDADHIRKAYSCVFLKTIVMSEVTLAYSHRKVTHDEVFTFMVTILKAYDNTDTWWLSRDQFTIEHWIDLFLKEIADTKEL